MMTFTTVAGVLVTIGGSAVAGKILENKGKPDLAETLRIITHLGAGGYALYYAAKLIQTAMKLFFLPF